MRSLIAILFLCLWSPPGNASPLAFDPSAIEKEPETEAPKMVLAYQFPRAKNDTIASISQKFFVAKTLIEKFNSIGPKGQLKSMVYVPLVENMSTHGPHLKAAKIVKLQRDAYLRPVFSGVWNSPEALNIIEVDDWLTPDDDQRMVFPVEGRMSSRFAWRWNRMHKGVDIAANIGTPIVAAQRGTVIFRGWKRGFGLVVILQHEKGRTLYAHCHSALVRNGQKVERGDTIARVGNTGHSFGAHLHFEYRDEHNSSIDPTAFLTPHCGGVALSAQPGNLGFFSGSLAAKAPRCHQRI